ncbi:Peptidase S8/S53, subtilisin/kexin/sedolisin [Metarhizium guizhouense ARSEF 977]|uniref:Peptidase S8/S53, subtilisin/kexin/sedolisin n=1 Tax=Metarhizium guizhouense (strain ARSEF 977) TaxID=1276136 RepID=A0A0B4GFL7_METGA|nr:Peptidase S8/S53, subtilisin/kexin/sedolisin [Metarhizium guizhouense ARSEF 977]
MISRTREVIRGLPRALRPYKSSAGSYYPRQGTDSTNGHDDKLNPNDTQQFTTPSYAKGVDSHKWLDSTALFASGITPFWKTIVNDFLEPRQNSATLEQIEADVVVALIDDGVAMFDPDLSNQVLEGKGFDFHGLKTRPPFSSAKGHGSVMTGMILGVFPIAMLYPIRLKTFDNENGKSNINLGYAAQGNLLSFQDIRRI